MNLKGREPGGHRRSRRTTRKCETSSTSALDGFRDPETGTQPDREDLPEGRGHCRGSSSTSAPDLLLVPAPFYSLTHAKGMVEEADWLSGDHRLEGVVVATGPEVTPGPLEETAYLMIWARRRWPRSEFPAGSRATAWCSSRSWATGVELEVVESAQASQQPSGRERTNL